MFTPIIVITLLLAWAGSFVMIYIGRDFGDVPITVTGIVMLALTSFVLVFH